MLNINKRVRSFILICIFLYKFVIRNNVFSMEIKQMIFFFEASIYVKHLQMYILIHLSKWILERVCKKKSHWYSLE